MNKLFTKVASVTLGLALALGIGVAVASHKEAARVDAVEVGSLVYTLDGSTTASGNAYATPTNLTQSEIGWSVTANTEQSPWRVGGKSLTAVDRAIYSKTAMADNIAQIEVTSGSTGSSLTVNSLTISVHQTANDAASGTDPVATKTVTSDIVNKTVTFTRGNDNPWAGYFYRIVYNVTRTSSSGNGYVEFSSAKFYKEKVEEVPISKLDIDATHSMYEGQSWTPTVTYNAGGTAPTTATSEFVVVSGEDYITVNEGTIYAKTGIVTGDPVTAVVKAHATDVAESSVYSSNCTITISAAEITGIEVTTAPSKTEYVEGQTLDLTGMVLTISWNYSGTTTISSGYDGVTTSPSLSTPLSIALHNNTEVVISYGGHNTAEGHGFNITVIAKEVIADGLTWTGMTVVYAEGDTLVADGLLTIKWNDGTTDSDVSVASLYASELVKFKIGGEVAVPGETVLTIDDHNKSNVNIYYGSYEGRTTSVQIRVLPVIVDYSVGAFYQVTSEPVDWTGSYIFNYEEKVFNGLDAENGYQTASIDSDNKRIEYNANFGVIYISSMTDGYSAYIGQCKANTNLGKYMGGTEGKNSLTLSDEKILNTISFNNSTKQITLLSNSTSFRFNNTAGQQRFRYFKTTTTGDSYIYPTIYKWISNADKVQEFIDSYMHMDENVPNQCEGYYPLAKAAFNNLTDAQKSLFIDEGGEGETYHDAYVRLSAWAAAHQEMVTNSGASANLRGGLSTGGLNETTIAIIITISVITAVGICAVIVLHKKKRVR